MDWKKLFTYHVLERGLQYYQDGCVNGMVFDEDQIQATVEGMESYYVEIDLEDGEVVDMFCSCPHAESGNHCKHMAAVLYEWENENEDDTQFDDLSHIINEADEAKIREFLKQILSENPLLKSHFCSFVKKEISHQDLKQIYRLINHCVNKYAGYTGYVEYHNCDDFIEEIQNFLYDHVQTMIDNHNYKEAFQLSCYLFDTVGNIELQDDEQGVLFIEECKETWRTLVDLADQETKDFMNQWFHQKLNSNLDEYLQEYIEEVVYDSFNDEKYLRKNLEEALNRLAYVSSYEKDIWLMRCVRMMRELNYKQSDIDAFCKENWESSQIRKYYIECRISEKKYDEAIEIVMESISMDEGKRGLIEDYKVRLKELYQATNNKVSYLNILQNLVINYHKMNYYLELKSQYSKEMWLITREKIFNSISSNYFKAELFNEELLFDRLLEIVQKNQDLYSIDKYFNVLVPHYPQEVLEMYRVELNKEALVAAGRSAYQRWVSYLRKMLKINGGKQVVNEMVCEWKKLYSNRRALMDELRHL